MSQSSCSCPSKSTIGLKVIVGVTGAAMFLFVIIHMLGNLQIFISAETINSYAHHLQSLPIPVLWGFRLGLLLMVTLHVVAVVKLIQINRAARPETYEVKRPLGTTFASRWMAVSGFIVLFFIAFHLWHFSVRGAPFEHYNEMTQEVMVDGQMTKVPDVFGRVVEAFSNPIIAFFYILSVGLLGLHLSHGAQSMFRSLGLGNTNTFGWQRLFARGMALIIFLGMAAVPLAVLLKLVK